MTAIFKVKRLRTIFIIYWFLLLYIVAALIWWFIALNQQNKILTDYRLQQAEKGVYDQRQTDKILNDKKRKTTQYIGEGVTFLLLILAGAVFIFRVVQRQFRQSRQQQNFIMAITHELKTPIAVTKLNLETLQKHRLKEDQQQRLLTNTLQEANRLNDLCNNMLLASQIEGGGYELTNEEIDLSALTLECAQDFSIRFPQRIVETHIETGIYFNGDKLLLQIAVNNLLDNAIKYSARESKVTIELKRENKMVLLLVKDEGKGIANAEKEKVFQKFYRVGNKYTKGARGTGLGLFLTKKIIQQHNGSIAVTNNVPHGSNFVICLKESTKNGLQ